MDNVKRELIKDLVTTTLATGKSPSIFSVPKALKLKSRLESSNTVKEVIIVLEEYSDFIITNLCISKTSLSELIVNIKNL